MAVNRNLEKKKLAIKSKPSWMLNRYYNVAVFVECLRIQLISTFSFHFEHFSFGLFSNWIAFFIFISLISTLLWNQLKPWISFFWFFFSFKDTKYYLVTDFLNICSTVLFISFVLEMPIWQIHKHIFCRLKCAHFFFLRRSCFVWYSVCLLILYK